MTAMPHPVPRGWHRSDDRPTASDRKLAAFLDRTTRRGPRSAFERERVALAREAAAAAERRAAIAAFTARQTRLAERLLGITEEDR